VPRQTTLATPVRLPSAVACRRIAYATVRHDTLLISYSLRIRRLSILPSLARNVRCFCLALLLVSCIVPGTADAHRHSTSIRIDSRTRLVVPAGAMPRGAYIVVDKLRDRTATAAPGLVAPPFNLRLVGAARLRRSARIEFRYPSGARPAKFRLGRWTGAKWRYTRLHDTRHRRVLWVSTRVSRGSARGRAHKANILDWGAGVFAEYGQFWGEVLNTRADRPNCTSDVPGWVESVTFANDAREPVFSCGMHDPNDANELEVHLTNNRSYGMWLSFEGAQPDWAWLNTPGIFWDDLRRTLAASARIFAGHQSDVYIPPGTEAHIGFKDPRAAFSIHTKPAPELVVVSGAISILESRLIGIRNKTMLAPLFVCDQSAATLLQTSSLASVAGAILDCARRSLSAIAAHKMAFLDNATTAYLSIKSKALAEIAAAMGVAGFSYQASDLAEMLLGSSWRTISVQHAFIPSDNTPKPSTPAIHPTLNVTGSCTTTGGTLVGSTGGFTPGGSATIHAWSPTGESYANIATTSTVKADGSITWMWPCAGDAAGTYTTEVVDDTSGASTGRVAFQIAPEPQSTLPPPPPTKGFVIHDDVYAGTWARFDPNDGTWYSHSAPPPNGKYWFANGLGVAVDCARSAAAYPVLINGQHQTWSWWGHVTDNTWVPVAVFSQVWSDGNPGVANC
jgi:hypothetical protein